MSASSSFTGNLGGQLPENYIVPSEPEEAVVKLRQYINDIAYSVNRKSSGYYVEQDTITGQQFVPTFATDMSGSTNYRPVLRKVVDFGTLPDSTTKSVAHSIATTEDFSFVKIYGCATEPTAAPVPIGATNSAIPIPYINTTTPGDSVELSIDATNVNVTTTTANYTAYTRCFVVLEWIQTV